ncbi:MAG: sulfate ABC transporter permease subunit CysT [Corallincola sp.]|nr:sulfate ABC transporter permease subunit CysT [Corallincola sp.]
MHLTYSVVPGFRPALAFTLTYLSLVVLVPLVALALKAFGLSPAEMWALLSEPRVVAAFKISLWTALLAAFLNIFIGLLIAWVLTRYAVPGRRLWDALVDLPFALPTAVAGITLTAIYAPNGWIGQYLSDWGLQVAFAPPGIVIALLFIGLPFIVRTVQPVLAELDGAIEEAAATLGANRAQTFWRVMLPNLLPALLTGFALAFARGIGEYGSVIFIAGNMPFVSEIVPLVIVTKLEQYDYAGATTVALAMLLLSFVLLVLINALQWWTRKWTGKEEGR